MNLSLLLTKLRSHIGRIRLDVGVIRSRLAAFLRERTARWVAAGALTLVLLFCVAQYLKLASRIDRLLADGPFSASTDIFSAPELVSAGEPLAVEDLAGKLESAGLSQSRGNPAGWFEVQPSAVTIAPGDGSGVRIEFAEGEVSRIRSLDDNAVHQEYRLAPQLLTNLSLSREKRRLVHFSGIPPSLVDAVTSAEDKRFFHHGGFDYRRIFKAAYIDFKDDRKQQGASTLTMQLSRALWLAPRKSWRRKVEEILITRHLERKLTKQQIFEDYANEIYLGRRGTFSINGFGEGARAFFGKELGQIDTGEAALLAGLVRAPSYYNPFRYPERALNRRNLVLALMLRNGQLTEAEYRAAVASPLNLAQPLAGDSGSSYFIAMLNDELQSRLGDDARHRLSVVSTLDPDLQRAAEAAVRSGLDEVDRQLRQRAPHDQQAPALPQAGLIALDPRTGEIKALVGGRNYGDSQVNHVLSMRQPGSVFKPFVYAAAIATALEGGPTTFTPASLLNDESTTFLFHGESYRPKDFSGDYQGEVTLRTALAESLNVPTVDLAQQIGYQRVVAMARRAGLNDSIQPTPSVALGAYETTPREIAAAYTVFANHGMWVRPTTIALVRSAGGGVLYRHDPETRPALDPRVAYIMVNMMQQVLSSGTGASVRSRGFLLPAAGKTGTSRDGWFAGFTSELLCVVWVGFDDNRDLNLEGARSALPIWASFMKRAAQFRPYSEARAFQPPPGVVSAEVCDASGELAGTNCPDVHMEMFIAGTEPASECAMHRLTAGTDPSDGRDR